jgi:parallel beta-helix repeat protein
VKSARVSIGAGLVLGLAVVSAPTPATAKSFTVHPGESIQAAVDAASSGDTIKVMPGDYTETHGGTAAVRITKRLKLLAKSKPSKGVRVRILPGPGQTSGILVEPENDGDPDVDRVVIKGFTVEGFSNNGIWLRHTTKFKILNNEAIDNLENGIWPTLSANGLVKKNVSYGSQDSALWVEASENVRVLKNELHHSPTGLEITVSKNILATKNDIHDNTVGIGLYHPAAAGLPPLGDDGDWQIVSNHVHDNNEPNSAPGGGLSAGLPPGGGILVLGVDNVTVSKNLIENNGLAGIGVVDWCIAAALAGPEFSCDVNPAADLKDPAPHNDLFLKNDLVSNGLAPPSGFEFLAADITLLLGEGTGNCFSANTPTATLYALPPSPLPEC